MIGKLNENSLHEEGKYLSKCFGCVSNALEKTRVTCSVLRFHRFSIAHMTRLQKGQQYFQVEETTPKNRVF